MDKLDIPYGNIVSSKGEKLHIVPLMNTKRTVAENAATAITTSATNITLNSATSVVEITNRGDDAVYIQFKTASETADASATNTSHTLLANQTRQFEVRTTPDTSDAKATKETTAVSIIAVSSTATVDVYEF